MWTVRRWHLSRGQLMSSYVDTHTHLYDKVYDQDRQAVFDERLKQA